jgi:AraC-like DNA-binding protein
MPKTPGKTVTKPHIAKGSNSTDDTFVKSFQMLIQNKKLVFQFMDMFPFHIEIFTPDGTAIFCNRACLEFNNIRDANLIIGKYNVLKDPILNDQMGLYDAIHKAFEGEIVNGSYSPPVQDLIDRGIIIEKPFESASMDFYFYPVWNGNELTYVVSVCTVRSFYQGRPDVARAKEYMDTHWQGDYNAEEVAKHVNMSVTQLYRLFKQHTGMTPNDYYKRCKIENIKEKLKDKNLSIKGAFAACGEDSQGWVLQVFKETTGLTPTKFRKTIAKKPISLYTFSVNKPNYLVNITKHLIFTT